MDLKNGQQDGKMSKKTDVKKDEQQPQGSQGLKTSIPSTAPQQGQVVIPGFENANLEELNQAATRIQASFRGHMNRKLQDFAATESLEKQMKEMGTAQESSDLDIDLSDPELNKAATKIQASFRIHKARKFGADEEQPETALIQKDDFARSQAAPTGGKKATKKLATKADEKTK